MMLLRPICNKILQHLDIRICLHLSYQRNQRLSSVQACYKKMLVDPSSTSVAARQWSRVEASVHCVDWRRSRACIISHRFIALYGTPLGSSHWATLTGTIQKNPGDMMAFQPRKFLHSQKVFVLYFEIMHIFPYLYDNRSSLFCCHAFIFTYQVILLWKGNMTLQADDIIGIWSTIQRNLESQRFTIVLIFWCCDV